MPDLEMVSLVTKLSDDDPSGRTTYFGHGNFKSNIRDGPCRRIRVLGENQEAVVIAFGTGDAENDIDGGRAENELIGGGGEGRRKLPLILRTRRGRCCPVTGPWSARIE